MHMINPSNRIASSPDDAIRQTLVGFRDDFARANGSAGNGWSAGDVAANKLVITPTLGSELLTNGNFSAWSGDNPTGWTVANETAPNIEVTQRSALQLHADSPAGTGACNYYVDAANQATNLQIRQTILTVDSWYSTFVEVTAFSVGALFIQDANSNMSRNIQAVGSFPNTGRATSTVFRLRGNTSSARDFTFDNVSVKAITLSTMFGTQTLTYVPRVISTAITRSASTQAGVVHYSDDNNWVAAYLDGSGNIVLLKRVGGTYTQVATASVVYVADNVLELRYSPSAQTYEVSYGGVTRITAQSVTDAVFTTAQKAGVFSTYNANTFDDFLAAA